MRRRDGGHSARRRLCVFAAVGISIAALVGAPTTAYAWGRTTASGNNPAKRTLVSVKLAGDPTSTAAVLDVLRERIGAADADASFEIVSAIDRASVVTPGPPDERQLARIWIDMTEPVDRAGAAEPVTLYVVDGPWERVLVRPVAREANPEVTWEEIGHIVELALGALRAGESIGVGRAVALEQLFPSPDPPPRPRRRREAPRFAARAPSRVAVSARGGVFYSTTAYGSGLELASGPGGIFELHADPHWLGGKLHFGAEFTGEYRFASTVDRGRALVRFEGAAFHLMASAGYRLSNRQQLFLDVGGGGELVHAKGESPDLTNVRFVNGNIDPIPTARVLTRYAWVATRTTRLFGAAGLDIPFRNPRYLLSRENEPVVLFEPWVIRPFVMIGIETN